MLVLVARFSSGEEYREALRSDFPNSGLLFPTRKAISAGTELLLDIRIPGLKDGMLIRGTVKWSQRGKRSMQQRAGLGIAFGKSEQSKVQYLLQIADGKLGDELAAQRRHRRLPVRVPVSWRLPNQVQKHHSQVHDIGTGGAFLHTKSPPAQGSAVILDVSPPGRGASQSIEGRVAWTNPSGAGVEFRCRDIAGMRRLRELVKRIEGGEPRVAS